MRPAPLQADALAVTALNSNMDQPWSQGRDYNTCTNTKMNTVQINKQIQVEYGPTVVTR
jgi:hypothetical protein